MLADLTISGLANEVADVSPAPGGGSVAALSGCLAAALAAMVCRLTIGKKGFEEHEAAMIEHLAAAEDLRGRLLTAIDDDTAAYLDVVAAYRRPRATQEESAARAAAIQAANRHAADVPLATAGACLDVLRLAGEIWPLCNKAAASDLGVATDTAAAGVHGSVLNVLINLGSIDDPAAVKALREAATAVAADSEAALAATKASIAAFISSSM